MESKQPTVEKLKPLVKSYARDMKLLIVEDQSSSIEFYKRLFGKFFNVCDVAYNGEEALALWNLNRDYYDLIITDVDMPITNGIELVKEMREYSIEQSIIVLTATTQLTENQVLAYYSIDGLLPKPIDNKKLFILLYRVLKKIAENKEYSHYVEELENQLNQSIEFNNHFNFIIDKLNQMEHNKEAQDVVAMLNTLVGKVETSIEEKQEKIILTENHENDLRFSTYENKLTASEFISEQNDIIIDKVEDFLDIINDYVREIDTIEEQEASVSIVSIHNLSRYFDTFIDILNNLVIFPIISRTFINLNNFIQNITLKDIEDHDRKVLLLSLLLNIETDISSWINNIFIEQTVDNVYYFDASFSNAVFEIESIFYTSEIDENEDFSDEELGFF